MSAVVVPVVGSRLLEVSTSTTPTRRTPLAGMTLTFCTPAGPPPHAPPVTHGADSPTNASGGPSFSSVQGHLESILSRDGMRTLERLVAHALTPVTA